MSTDQPAPQLKALPVQHVVDALTVDDAAALACLLENGRCKMKNALIMAVQHRAFRCIDAMLATGLCSVNTWGYSRRWKRSYDMLTLALHNDDVVMARWLYKQHGARWPNPKYWNYEGVVLYKAIRDARPASVLFLLEHKMDPNYHALQPCSPLTVAISHRSLASAVLLLQHKADVNTQPFTTLRVSLGQQDTLAMVLRAKIDVDAVDKDTGNTALHSLFTGRSLLLILPLVQQLLEAKADPHIRNKKGALPVRMMRHYKKSKIKRELRQLLAQ
jgi:hypothetical protein